MRGKPINQLTGEQANAPWRQNPSEFNQGNLQEAPLGRAAAGALSAMDRVRAISAASTAAEEASTGTPTTPSRVEYTSAGKQVNLPNRSSLWLHYNAVVGGCGTPP